MLGKITKRRVCICEEKFLLLLTFAERAESLLLSLRSYLLLKNIKREIIKRVIKSIVVLRTIYVVEFNIVKSAAAKRGLRMRAMAPMISSSDFNLLSSSSDFTINWQETLYEMENI